MELKKLTVAEVCVQWGYVWGGAWVGVGDGNV